MKRERLLKSFGLTVGLFAASVAAVALIAFFPISVPLVAVVVMFCLAWKRIYDHMR